MTRALAKHRISIRLPFQEYPEGYDRGDNAVDKPVCASTRPPRNIFAKGDKKNLPSSVLSSVLRRNWR